MWFNNYLVLYILFNSTTMQESKHTKLKLDELQRDSVDTFKSKQKTQICLLLDDIRSLNNVGSSFRTADAFALEKIWLCGITGTPPHRDIHKTALGATETVTWEHRTDILTLIEELKTEGWIIVSVEQATNSVMLNDFKPVDNHKYAFIFGNEVDGVNEDVIDNSDVILEIPQFGTKHSFNVSVSMGIVLWHSVFSMKY